MRAYYSMPSRDFIYQLRDIAVSANARPLVIDAIDELLDAPSYDEIEKEKDDAIREVEKEIRENVAHDWEMAVKAAEIELDDMDELSSRTIERIMKIIKGMRPDP